MDEAADVFVSTQLLQGVNDLQLLLQPFAAGIVQQPSNLGIERHLGRQLFHFLQSRIRNLIQLLEQPGVRSDRVIDHHLLHAAVKKAGHRHRQQQDKQVREQEGPKNAPPRHASPPDADAPASLHPCSPFPILQKIRWLNYNQ
ncbi:MAG: hypothetical protein E6230_20100 [Paenibacillus dendritiformis]|uniref:hypothetical protein n=1 Tax=uncultured Paenibacillus sp. TaxID=227322 RepID=UPI0025E3AB3A|nr:hypothetical protein [uncultured Paenibacillus sp.]MDU5144475.1 hypothetical protein [Paenibacillus dendritiformis]